MRQTKSFPFFLVLLVVCTLLNFLSPVFADDPVRQFAKAVVKLLFGGEVNGRRIMSSLQWEEDLNRAIRIVRESEGANAGSGFGKLSPGVVEAARARLLTPQKARIFISEMRLESRLDEAWSQIFDEYILSAGGLAESYMRMFTHWVTTSSNYEFLRRYYAEEIKGGLRRLLENSSQVSGVLNKEDLRNLLSRIDHFFNQWSYRRTDKDHWPLVREYLDNVIEIFDRQIARMESGIERRIYDVGDLSYVKDFKGLYRQVKGYRFLFSQDLVLGRDYLVEKELLDDFLLSHIRYGDLPTKKAAFHCLVQSNFIGNEGLSYEILKGVLSTPHHHFRRHALSCLMRHIRVLEEEITHRGRSHVDEIRNSLEALYLKTVAFFPGEKSFEETIETILVLLINRTEGRLAEVLDEASTSIGEKIGAIRGLGILDSPAAFEKIVERYFQTEFRASLNHSQLLKAYVEVLLGTLSHPRETDTFWQRREVILKLFRAMVFVEGGNPPFQRMAVWGMGEALRGEWEAPTFNCLKALIESKSIAPGLKAEAILALTKLPYSTQTVAMITPYLNDADMELKVAATLYIMNLTDTLESSRTAIISLLAVMRGSQSLEPEYTVLLHHLGKKNGYDAILYDPLMRLARGDVSQAVKMKALTILARHKERGAAQLLLDLSDQVSDSQVMEIMSLLLTHFDQKSHSDILRAAFRKIIGFYQRTDIEFDVWDFVGDSVVVERLGFFKGDSEMLRLFRSVTLDPRSSLPRHRNRWEKFFDVALEILE